MRAVFQSLWSDLCFSALTQPRPPRSGAGCKKPLSYSVVWRCNRHRAPLDSPWTPRLCHLDGLHHLLQELKVINARGLPSAQILITWRGKCCNGFNCEDGCKSLRSVQPWLWTIAEQMVMSGEAPVAVCWPLSGDLCSSHFTPYS